MDEHLCLLTVHAHPDDEASKGAGTVAKYKAGGVRTVLVCATGGEAGDILNPEMDRPDVRENLAEVRRRELARSADIIGYDHVEMLGYRDSGMPDTPENAHPEAFVNADLGEAVGRLVALIRRHRPQVIVTYDEDQSGYPHPDHIRVHDISLSAFDLAGDPDAYPEAGDPWEPHKLYYTTWSRARIEALHAKMMELGVESPFNEDWFKRPSRDHLITTRIDVTEHYEVRQNALLAHATQVDPTSKFWFGLPTDVARSVHPWDDYLLGRSRVDTEIPEDDLFAGIRVRSQT